ncbi:MAG: tRNA preQ1(34) S-adenosylmethionine ribosyltransferase-isomerase QueA [Thermodesulfobacteriota bacterium]
MKASDFDYELLDEQIAYRPENKRPNSKLLLLNKENGSISHKHFYDLPDLLKNGDMLVLNDTRVIPARLKGKRANGSDAEILLVQKITDHSWECLVRNPKHEEELILKGGVNATLLRQGKQTWIIEFKHKVDEYIQEHGNMPLPPYIDRAPDESDKTTYQTVYAKHKGAIAAPTAGLHFTNALLDQISAKGVELQYVTLHVGIGTFKPVKVDDVEDHKMHEEFISISDDTARAINKAKSEARKVIAVGTTVVRTLESSVGNDGKLLPFSGQTDLFITPGYKFHVVDGLITNFHLPRSTLLMLVSAFSDREFIFNAYSKAREMNYRFLSYGDAMFIN